MLRWWMFRLWLFLGRTGVFISKHLPLNHRFQRIRFKSFSIFYVTEVNIVVLSLNICICYISEVLHASALEYHNESHVISELIFVTTDDSISMSGYQDIQKFENEWQEVCHKNQWKILICLMYLKLKFVPHILKCVWRNINICLSTASKIILL